MWKLDYKESSAQKNWCFWTVLLEKTLVNLLGHQQFKPVHPKGSQSWIFLGRTDAEAETPILWPFNMKNWLIWKDPDSGKDWRQEEKGRQSKGWLDDITDLMSLSKLGDLEMEREACVFQSMGLQNQTWLSEWIWTDVTLPLISETL